MDLEAVVELDCFSKRDRSRLLLFFEKLRSHPEHHASTNERDNRGRRIDIASHAGWLIYYWTDFADRHVKILKVQRVAGGLKFKKQEVMNHWAKTNFISTHSSCGIKGSESHVLRITKRAHEQFGR